MTEPAERLAGGRGEIIVGQIWDHLPDGRARTPKLVLRVDYYVVACTPGKPLSRATYAKSYFLKHYRLRSESLPND